MKTHEEIYDDTICQAFQYACNELAQSMRENPTQIAADNPYYLASDAIQNAWPDLVGKYIARMTADE